jgi:hypothetical protein
VPSPIAHSAVGYVIYRAFRGCLLAEGDNQETGALALLTLSSGLSLLPDVDALAGLALDDMRGIHNNLTHSLVTGAGVATLSGAWATRKRRSRFLDWFLFTLCCYESHVLMDFFSSRRGVMLLWPFTSRRFMRPVKLFYGFRWSRPLTSREHVLTAITETTFVLAIHFMLKLPRLPKKGAGCAECAPRKRSD